MPSARGAAFDSSSKKPHVHSMVQNAVAWRRLRTAALLSLGLHLVAGAAMLCILRHGLETNPDLRGRMTFLVDQTGLWVAGWLTWNAAALSILYYYAAFAWAHAADGKTSASPLHLAVILSTAGIAADLAAEAIEMGVLPGLAESALFEAHASRTGIINDTWFFTLHRTAVMLTGYLANGLYTLSALLLVRATRHAYPGWVQAAGWGLGAAGLCLSGATLGNAVAGMQWASAALVPCIVLWQLGVAISATQRLRSASQ